MKATMMIFKRPPVLFVISVALIACLACGEKGISRLDEGLQLYDQNKLGEALPLLEQAVQQQPEDPSALAWLAETYRRLDRRQEAIERAREALRLDPDDGFAHTVLAYAYYPVYGQWEGADVDTTWHHLLKAIECDSGDGNAWTGIWTEAIRREQRDWETRAIRRMYQADFFTPALLSYNRWMLRHLPENALLLTNGDMDTYPAVALQAVENFRPDVMVVNRSLLNTPWYARYLRDVNHLPLPFDEAALDTLRWRRDENGQLRMVSDQIIRGWLRMRSDGQFARPIAISVTVGDRSFASDTRDHLCLFGPFYSWFAVPSASAQDTAMLRISLSGIDPKDFSGPLASEGDRSPVRRAGTDRLVENITHAALVYGETLLESGQPGKAQKILEWAKRFEKKTRLGPRFTELIDDLKEQAREKMK